MYNFEVVNLDLIEEILSFIVEGDHDYPRGGAILVFLPGVQEIVNACDQLACKSLSTTAGLSSSICMEQDP